MATREVYQINQRTGARSYAGYARFGNDGKFQGTFGGYTGSRAGRNGNNRNNGASRVQNVIATVGSRQAARRPRILG